MYRLVSFDFDGTLADSGDWFFRMTNELALEFGFKTIPDSERDFVRGLDTHQAMKHLRIPLWKLPQILVRMRRLGTRDRHVIHLFPGVHELFQQLLTRGVELSIVSSNTEETIRNILGPKTAGAVTYYGCGSSLFGKAAKLRTLLRQSKRKSADVIYIGDETRDAAAAQQANIDFGAVTWGYATPAALMAHSPKFCFRDFPEILSLWSSSARTASSHQLQAKP